MKKIICLVGASGSGKSTLENELANMGCYSKIISTTTREKRNGEVDGEHYYFVTEREFRQLNLIENTYFAGKYYGITLEELERYDNDVIFVVEPHGLKQIQEYVKDNPLYKIITIFFHIPENIRYENMVTGRGDDPQKARIRLQMDNINKLWLEYNHKPDISITKLTQDLAQRVHETIQSF